MPDLTTNDRIRLQTKALDSRVIGQTLHPGGPLADSLEHLMAVGYLPDGPMPDPNHGLDVRQIRARASRTRIDEVCHAAYAENARARARAAAEETDGE